MTPQPTAMLVSKITCVTLLYVPFNIKEKEHVLKYILIYLNTFLFTQFGSLFLFLFLIMSLFILFHFFYICLVFCPFSQLRIQFAHDFRCLSNWYDYYSTPHQLGGERNKAGKEAIKEEKSKRKKRIRFWIRNK